MWGFLIFILFTFLNNISLPLLKCRCCVNSRLCSHVTLCNLIGKLLWKTPRPCHVATHRYKGTFPFTPYLCLHLQSHQIPPWGQVPHAPVATQHGYSFMSSGSGVSPRWWCRAPPAASCPAAPQSSEGDAAAASLHPCPCQQPSGMFLGFLGQGREPRDVQEALCVGKQRRLLQQKGRHLAEATVLFPVETPTQKMK